MNAVLSRSLSNLSIEEDSSCPGLFVCKNSSDGIYEYFPGQPLFIQFNSKTYLVEKNIQPLNLFGYNKVCSILPPLEAHKTKDCSADGIYADSSQNLIQAVIYGENYQVIPQL